MPWNLNRHTPAELREQARAADARYRAKRAADPVLMAAYRATRDVINARKRAAYTDPAVKAARNEAKRAWRARRRAAGLPVT